MDHFPLSRKGKILTEFVMAGMRLGGGIGDWGQEARKKGEIDTESTQDHREHGRAK
jgi:hypothetical protein